MEFTKPESYVKQIGIYIESSDFQSAYDLSQGFAQKFPEEMIAHFFVAKTAFQLGKYDETAQEGRAAFNLSKDPHDMLACALLASTGYYEIKDYAKGYSLLKQMESVKIDIDLKKLLFVFSIALKDETEAMRHVNDLYKMNEKAAEELIVKFLKSSV